MDKGEPGSVSYFRHKCSKRSGWSIFGFDSCDGCLRAALAVDAYDVATAAAVRTTLRRTKQIPHHDQDRLPPEPEDLAHVQDLWREVQTMMISWTTEPLREITEITGIARDSEQAKQIETILRVAIARALS